MFCLFIHVIFKILNHFKFVLLKLCLKDLLLCGLDVTTLRFAYEEMGDGGGGGEKWENIVHRGTCI